MIRLLTLPWSIAAWVIPKIVGDPFDNVYAHRLLD
jgi:hypothetical protein